MLVCLNTCRKYDEFSVVILQHWSAETGGTETEVSPVLRLYTMPSQARELRVRYRMAGCPVGRMKSRVSVRNVRDMAATIREHRMERDRNDQH